MCMCVYVCVSGFGVNDVDVVTDDDDVILWMCLYYIIALLVGVLLGCLGIL